MARQVAGLTPFSLGTIQWIGEKFPSLRVRPSRAGQVPCFSDPVISSRLCNPSVQPTTTEEEGFLCALHWPCKVHLAARLGLGLVPGESPQDPKNFERALEYARSLSYDKLLEELESVRKEFLGAETALIQPTDLVVAQLRSEKQPTQQNDAMNGNSAPAPIVGIPRAPQPNRAGVPVQSAPLAVAPPAPPAPPPPLTQVEDSDESDESDEDESMHVAPPLPPAPPVPPPVPPMVAPPLPVAAPVQATHVAAPASTPVAAATSALSAQMELATKQLTLVRLRLRKDPDNIDLQIQEGEIEEKLAALRVQGAETTATPQTAAPVSAPVAASPVEAPAPRRRGRAAKAKEEATAASTDAPAPVAPEPVAAAPKRTRKPADPTKTGRRGRPKGSKNKPKLVDMSSAASLPVVPRSVAAAPAPPLPAVAAPLPPAPVPAVDLSGSIHGYSPGTYEHTVMFALYSLLRNPGDTMESAALQAQLTAWGYSAANLYFKAIGTLQGRGLLHMDIGDRFRPLLPAAP